MFPSGPNRCVPLGTCLPPKQDTGCGGTQPTIPPFDGADLTLISWVANLSVLPGPRPGTWLPGATSSPRKPPRRLNKVKSPLRLREDAVSGTVYLHNM